MLFKTTFLRLSFFYCFVVLLLRSKILGMILRPASFEALFTLLTTSKKPLHTFPFFHVLYVL